MVMTMRHSLFLLAALPLFAQRDTVFETRPALVVENNKVALVMLRNGGAFTSLTLKDDEAKTDPLWNPLRMAREKGRPQRFGDSVGHFVCVDGFGPTSNEERAAGYEGHGEAHKQPWELINTGFKAGVRSLTFRARLPIMQELFTRRIEIVDDEQVVYVESTLENLLAFDRPVNWAEHATIGAPFLAPGKTVVDAATGRCQSRPYENQPVRRLASGKDFQYPLAVGRDGTSLVDIRNVPDPPSSLDHTGCTVDPSRRLGFVTAINLEKGMMLGYLWRREEYPWLQEWMNYPASGELSRGLEFGTQPFDVSHRQTVDMGSMFGVPVFRWLAARTKISSRFLMFFSRVPQGFNHVDDVTLSDGKLTIVDKKAGKTVTLHATLGL